MNKHKEVLEKVKLFDGISWSEIESLLTCLEAKVKKYNKNSYIIQEDDEVNFPGVILSGKVEITKEGVNGNKAILSFLEATDIFGEVMASSAKKKSLVNVIATVDTEILFVNFNKILHTCKSNCSFHIKLISNMLMIISEKNIALNRKMDYLLIKNMREKLSAFLFSKYKESKSLSFSIRLNRNELADYLNVSRASMCRELSRMKDEGIIDYYKDSFKILDLNLLRSI